VICVVKVVDPPLANLDMSADACPVGATPLMAGPVSVSLAPPPAPPLDVVCVPELLSGAETIAVLVASDSAAGLVGVERPHPTIASNIADAITAVTFV
jgi:hypothetical protein